MNDPKYKTLEFWKDPNTPRTNYAIKDMGGVIRYNQVQEMISFTKSLELEVQRLTKAADSLRSHFEYLFNQMTDEQKHKIIAMRKAEKEKQAQDEIAKLKQENAELFATVEEMKAKRNLKIEERKARK